MKITVDFDCTPEEARRLVGLPDMSQLHEMFLDQLRRTMAENMNGEMLEPLIRSWLPLGEAGMNFWGRLFEQPAKPDRT